METLLRLHCRFSFPKNLERVSPRKFLRYDRFVFHICYFCWLADSVFFPCFLYPQIGNAEFSFPSWFSAGAKALIKRILDPNPQTVSSDCQSLCLQWQDYSVACPSEELRIAIRFLFLGIVL